MGLTLTDTDWTDAFGLLEEWRFGARPFFMTSGAYETLLHEMRRYVVGDVTGRSFLIAAHRGVGKTSLVLRAVSDLTRELLRKAMDNAKSSERISGPPPQRPLLVKLHASTLLSPVKSEESVSPRPTKPPGVSAEAAIQQITIALYRALAHEVAEAFSLHAREAASGARALGDLPEIAAQLTLDLDLAPDLMALRAYWKLLGRLELGVLWPGSVGRQLIEDGMADRGMREIVALATANQAFQVCAGRVEASQSAKGSAERVARIETAVRIDAKDAANKLFGLTAGGLVGGALLSTTHSGVAAAATGLATALFASLALGWSAERRHRTQRSSDYSFIMDRSLQTLDRDLPVVIERVRQAGLAPVFLIDELDKLDDTAGSIEAIVRRLKNLTTDYGFFCFLTDREYYQEIEAKLRTAAYPSEHTFFSHRFLLLYRPADLARHIRNLWSSDTISQDDSIAAWVLTCYVMHRARLNTMDVGREVAKLCGNNGKLLPDPKQVGTDPQYLVPMATQLAIEHIMRKPDIRLRIESDNAFAQAAVDVLYMISRAWEDGEDGIVITEATVRKYLLDRRPANGKNSSESKTGTPETLSDEPVNDADLRTLTSTLLELAALLSSFPTIGSAIYSEPGLLLPSPPPLPTYATTTDSEGAKLTTLLPQLRGIPSFWPGLISVPDETDPSRFLFRFDRYGTPHVDLDETFKAVQSGVRLFDDLAAALKDRGLSIEDLLAIGVLPATLQQIIPGLEVSVARLRRVPDGAALAQVPREQIDAVATLAAAVRQLRSAIIAIVALVKQIRDYVRPAAPGSLPAMEVLVAIDRSLGIEPLCAVLSAPPGTAPPRQSLKSPTSPLVDWMLPQGAVDADHAGNWAAAIAAESDRLHAIIGAQEAHIQRPEDWQRRVTGWLLNHDRAVDPPIGFADLTAVAANSFPAADLRPDLEVMTIAEWSNFTNKAFARRANADHFWAFPAGLRALGFEQRILLEAGGGDIADGAATDRSAVLLTYSAVGDVATPPDLERPPVFAIPLDGRDAYAEVVTWLLDHEAIGGTAIMED